MCSLKQGFICKKPKNGTLSPFTTPAPIIGGCPAGYVPFRNKCYQFNTHYSDVIHLRKNWTEAQAHCRAQGPGFYLASIADRREQGIPINLVL